MERDFRPFNAVGFSLNIKNVLVHRLESFVLVLDERQKPAFKIECLGRRLKPKLSEIEDIGKVNPVRGRGTLRALAASNGVDRFCDGARINHRDPHPLHEIRLLAHVTHHAAKIKRDALLEYRGIRLKKHHRAVPVRCAYFLHSRLCGALSVFLVKHAAVAVHEYFHVHGERVDHRRADAVEASGNLIA